MEMLELFRRGEFALSIYNLANVVNPNVGWLRQLELLDILGRESISGLILSYEIDPLF